MKSEYEKNPKGRADSPLPAADVEETPRPTLKWFTWVVGSFFAALLLVVGVVLAVNPYQLYRVSICKPAYIDSHAYQMIPGLLRHETYETALVGSCMAQNFRISEMEAVPGWGRVIKATGAGASFKTLDRFMEAVLATKKARHVFFMLDVTFTTGGGIFNLEDQVLEYLFDSAIWNDYQYFLNWDVLTAAVPRALKANLGFKRHAPALDRDLMFAWDYGNRPDRYGADKVRGGFIQWGDALAGIRGNAVEQAAYYQNSVETRLFDNMRANSNILFTVCYAPYSSAFWHAVDAYGGLEPFLDARENLMRQMLAMDNVVVYDFQGDPITEDYSHYSDPWHYDATINTWIIQAIAAGRGRIDNEDAILAANNAVRERCLPEKRPTWMNELTDKRSPK
ncbi:MAG: hypothetical protein FWF96_05730 [Kiritimatiellaeota bacterium]|nr:hypothetical protein [Kiritimatiellota bacterium]